MWIARKGLLGRQTSKQSGRLATIFDSGFFRFSESHFHASRGYAEFLARPLRVCMTGEYRSRKCHVCVCQRRCHMAVCVHTPIGSGPSVPRTNTNRSSSNLRFA